MSKLISQAGTAEYKRWQVPDVAPGAERNGYPGPNRYLTAVQLEKIQKQAYEEAYARGLREGAAAGQAQAREQTKLFVALANSLEQPLRHADESVERELLQLCLAIAKQIIRREISLDPGQIVAVIREAVAALPTASQKLRVCLHPEDAAVARELLAQSAATVTWTLVEDAAVARGGCKLFSEYSQVDATLEKRLALIAAKIMGGERTGDAARDSASGQTRG